MRPSAIVLCNLSMMCMATATNIPPVYLTTFGQVFGTTGPLTPEQLGRLGAFVFAGYMLGLIACSPLANRYNNPRAFLMAGHALAALSLVLIALSTSYVMLLISVLLVGVGAGIIELLASPVVSILSVEHKTSAMNKLHAYYAIGAVATISICSFFMWVDVNWRWVCASLAALPVFCFIGFAVTPVPKLVATEDRTRVRDLLRKPFFLLTLVAIILSGASELGAVTWLAAYAEKGLDYPNWIGGFALATFYLGMSFGRFAASVAVVKIGPLRMLAMACIVTIACISGAVLCPVRIAALASAIAIGVAASCMWPTTLGIIVSKFSAGGASMFGIIAALGNSGGVIMPWLMGIVTQKSNIALGFAVDMAAPLLLLAIIFVLSRISRKAGS